MDGILGTHRSGCAANDDEDGTGSALLATGLNGRIGSPPMLGASRLCCQVARSTRVSRSCYP